MTACKNKNRYKNMGQHQSVFAHDEFVDSHGKVQKMILPIPQKLYESMAISIAELKMGSEGASFIRKYAPSFKAFVHTPERINEMINYGMYNHRKFANLFLEKLFEIGEIKNFLRANPGFDTQTYNLEVIHYENSEPRLKSPMDKNTEIMRLRVNLETALRAHEDYTGVVNLFVITKGVEMGHANMMLISFTASTQDLSAVIFEPHARHSPKVNERALMIKSFLDNITKDLKSQESFDRTLVTTDVFYPMSRTGLQTNSPICVQWSLIMFLIYLLNCKVHENVCDRDSIKSVMSAVWLKRKQIIPMWLFYIESIRYTKTHPDKYRSGIETFLRPNPMPVAEFGGKRQQYHPNVALDVMNCSARDKTHCTPPCKFKDNVCYNAALIKRKRKRDTDEQS